MSHGPRTHQPPGVPLATGPSGRYAKEGGGGWAPRTAQGRRAGPVLRSRAVKADLVLVGDVYTVDAARRWEHAVAVSGDRIVAVGTESAVLERVGAPDAGVPGALLLPG